MTLMLVKMSAVDSLRYRHTSVLVGSMPAKERGASAGASPTLGEPLPRLGLGLAGALLHDYL